MKIIQLNTWMGRLSRAIVRFISEEKPDILCLQEVFKSAAPIAYPEDRMFDIFGLIKEIGIFNDDYFSPLISMDIAGGTTEFGNAIFSRYPMLMKEAFFTDGSKIVEHFTQAQNQAAGNNPARGAQLVVIESGADQKIAVLNQHFHWSKNPLGDGQSVVKMKMVAEKARKFDNLPLLVCGDFNLRSESPAMRVFDNWLENLTARTGVESTLSGLKFARNEVKVACDYVLVNDKVKVIKVDVSEVLVSDHLPVVVEFSI